MVEIFEFRTNPQNGPDMRNAAVQFAQAAVKVPGLISMKFIESKESPGVVWQILEWQDEPASRAGQKHYFALSEMSLFSAFLMSPPRRVGDFQALA